MSLNQWDLLQMLEQEVTRDDFLLLQRCVPKSRGIHSPPLSLWKPAYDLLRCGLVSPGEHSGLGKGPGVLASVSFNTVFLDSTSRLLSVPGPGAHLFPSVLLVLKPSDSDWD